MKRLKPLSVFFGILLLFLVFGCENSKKNDSAGASGVPVLSIIDEVGDFGTVKAGEKVTREFRVRNMGSGTLLIADAVPSCECTSARVLDKTLAPGAVGSIRVTYDSTGYTGEQVGAVKIVSNDNTGGNAVIWFMIVVE